MKTFVKIIFGTFLSLLATATYAADIDLSVSPLSQPAISGSALVWNVTVTNNTGIDAYLAPNLGSAQEIVYKNATTAADNTPLITLIPSTDPYWKVAPGQTVTLTIEAKVQPTTYALSTSSIDMIVASDIWGSSVFTSAVASLTFVPDLMVSLLQAGTTQIAGDPMMYTITLQNIGSAIATGVRIVDTFPTNVLDFPMIGYLNGVGLVPTLYGNQLNAYQFAVADLLPGQLATLTLQGTLKTGVAYTTTYVNQASVFTATPQYATTNDTVSANGIVAGTPDLSVNVSLLSGEWAQVGDEVTFVLTYTNQGTVPAEDIALTAQLLAGLDFVSSFPMYQSVNGNILHWTISTLDPGVAGTIIFTGSLSDGMQVGDIFSLQTAIAASSVESNYTNNTVLTTGAMKAFDDVVVDLYAANLTRSAMNINTGATIQAVSGDNVQVTVVYTNRGNTDKMTHISLNGVSQLLGVNTSLLLQNITIPAHTQGTIVVEGVVANKNFGTITPSVSITYDSTTRTDSVTIQEPLVCGDGLITQNETCDTAAQAGVLYSGQVCENINGSCMLQTKYIINSVCFDYVTALGTGEQCTNSIVEFVTDKGQCISLTAPHTVVIVDENNQGSMQFSCVASGANSTVVIDCGNGTTHTGTQATCSYTYVATGNNRYTVACYVDGMTNSSCTQSTLVDPGFYGVCGDGELQLGEECDYEGDEDQSVTIGNYLNDQGSLVASDDDEEGKICRGCRIRDEAYAYESPACLGVNTSISVQAGEKLPFRWRLETSKNMKIKDSYDCADIAADEDKTYIDEDSMKCTFKVYNAKSNLQSDDDEITTITKKCNIKEDSQMFDYFYDYYGLSDGINSVFGRYIIDINEDVLDELSTKAYGEYKLVLENVAFDYCDPTTKTWEAGDLYDRVCEINFTITKPYMIQKSLFNNVPQSSTIDLDDYYAFTKGGSERLIKTTDLEDVMTLDVNDYDGGVDMMRQINEFTTKYEKLALKVNVDFGDNVTEVKKVPNKQIYIVKGDGDLVFKQQQQFTTPFTMIVQGMDVVVEGSFDTNGMIVTDGTLTFNDAFTNDGRCQVGGQVVKGIFITKKGFARATNELETKNIDLDKERCSYGNLAVKGVLIGPDILNLVVSKRANLNHWFLTTATTEAGIKAERRNEIFKGAALLIEYSPSLWAALPPGAEDFTQALEVYKK